MSARPDPGETTNPLRRLFRYARQYRRDVVWATIYSVLNKFFDILPEVLIGIAVDVVVNRKASFLARAGLADPHAQIVGLAIATVLIWVGESLFRVPVRRALAKPRAEPPARPAHGRLRPRAAAGPVVVREPAHRRADVGAQRRHQPDGALPERRRQRSDPGRDRLGAGRRGLLHADREDRRAGAAAGPADHRRRVLVPAPAGAALRRGARARRQPERAPQQQPARHRHHQGVHRRGVRGRPRPRRPPTPTARPTAARSGSRRRSRRSSAWRSSPASR